MRKGQDLPIRIISVSDGDSLVFVPGNWFWSLFTRRRRLRLYGIDAPELGQPYGAEAKQALEGMLGARHRLRVEDFDRYGRVVGVIYDTDTRDSYNARMVAGGHAHYYRRYGGSQYGLAEAEAAAKGEGRGLWRSYAGETPWDYRGRSREAASKYRWLLVTLLVLAVIVFVFLWLGYVPNIGFN